MTKEQVTKKINQIISKDPQIGDVVIKIKYSDKKKSDYLPSPRGQEGRVDTLG